MHGGNTVSGYLDPHDLLPFVDGFSERCADEGHAFCSLSMPCLLLRDSLRQQAAYDAEARSYDVGLVMRDWDGMPSAEWPVAALIGLVRRRLSEPPWVPDRFRRAVEITSALARLGEQGIPADGLIRGCLQASLRRALLTYLGSAAEAVADRQLDANALPPQLMDWWSLTEGADLLGKDLMIELLTGPAADEVNAWINKAAVAHLLDWRRDAQQVVIEPEDLTLPAGLEATQWVFDRFTFTSLDDWARASLDWELAYSQQSLQVIRRVGLAPEVLKQRPVSPTMIIAALTRRLSWPGAGEQMLNGRPVGEVVENLVALVQQGNRDQALALARASLKETPDHPVLVNAFAFLLLPDDPVAALPRLEALERGGRGPMPVVRLNIAAALLRLGRRQEALDVLRHAQASEEGAWLWEPDSLEEGCEPVLTRFRISDWLHSVQASFEASAGL